MKVGKTAASTADSSLTTNSGTTVSAVKAGSRQLRWVVDSALPFALCVTAAVAVLLPAGLSTQGRLALFAFAVAAILWITTSLSPAYVAFLAVAVMILSGAIPQARLFDALASDVVWLMIGAFVVGGAFQKSGLAARLTRFLVDRAHTVAGVFWLLTLSLIPLALFLPSTSGRAAVAVPVYYSIVQAAQDARITRALALLMPTVILLSAMGTLIGAGSHLLADDLLLEFSGQRISYATWLIYGLPLSLAACAVACWLILRMFLDRKLRRQPLSLEPRTITTFNRAEKMTLQIGLLLMALWLSSEWHGLDVATVTFLGALLLTMPGIGVLKWKQAVDVVPWNLILFVGAALVLGRALTDTGAAKWLVDGVVQASGLLTTQSELLILISMAAISLTAHLYMTSHVARVAAILPTFLVLSDTLELNPVMVVFLVTVAMDYCLTLPVSSKALLMFQELEGKTFDPNDLLRLSAVMLPITLLLLLFFYYVYWQWIGLAL